jgi:hypothetical protein
MFHTPFFRPWRPQLAPLGSRTPKAVKQVGSFTLCQLEKCFAPWVPPDLFPKTLEKANSRDQHYTRWRTFWCMIWQALNPNAPGREVVRQLQALFKLEGGPTLSEEDGAYCRARARLELAEFPKALAATAKAADKCVQAGISLLRGRPIKGADGSSVTLPDMPKNRAAYPPIQCPKGPSFPMMRLVVLWSMVSGAIVALAHGSLLVSELSLLTLLTSQLAKGDILLGDRGFGNYALIALLQHTLGVDFVGRPMRKIDGRRRLKRLGHNDWLIQWTKPFTSSPWLSVEQWLGLPQELTLRTVKGSLYRKGYRVRRVTTVTTLLDPQLYPAQEILQAYLRRWRLEMCLDDIKTTLQMEMLRCHSPKMCQQEVFTRLIAHNLIRCTMAQAAAQHDVPLDQISFKGSVDAVRQFAQAMAQARSQKKRQDLWAELLKILAIDLLPDRPGRREPRAVKRKKNKYPRLNVPRHKFRDHPKRHDRRRNSRLRNLAAM